MSNSTKFDNFEFIQKGRATLSIFNLPFPLQGKGTVAHVGDIEDTAAWIHYMTSCSLFSQDGQIDVSSVSIPHGCDCAQL